MNPANAAELRAALERHGFRFSKSKGQNFLIDPNIPRRIAAISGAAEDSAGRTLRLWLQGGVGQAFISSQGYLEAVR